MTMGENNPYMYYQRKMLLIYRLFHLTVTRRGDFPPLSS